MEREANPGRARLMLLIVSLGVVLLRLTPYLRAFTRILSQAEALQLDLSAARAATDHAQLGRRLMGEDRAEATHHLRDAEDEEHLPASQPPGLRVMRSRERLGKSRNDLCDP